MYQHASHGGCMYQHASHGGYVQPGYLLRWVCTARVPPKVGNSTGMPPMVGNSTGMPPMVGGVLPVPWWVVYSRYHGGYTPPWVCSFPGMVGIHLPGYVASLYPWVYHQHPTVPCRQCGQHGRCWSSREEALGSLLRIVRAMRRIVSLNLPKV